MRGTRFLAFSATVFLSLFAGPAASAPPPVAYPSTSVSTSGPIPGVAVASAALTEDAAAWDGRVVTFSGEAVGEPMVRGDHAWLHLNDDAYQTRAPLEAGCLLGGYNSGQAIWAPAALARRVRTFGGYRREGDSVRVLGTFNAACREHGGDMDIHATSLEIVHEGYVVTHPLHAGRLACGLALLALAGILALVRRPAGRWQT
jgi:hypothetical protein